MNLDFMPSPSPEHPGLFIRDPYRFSDAMLVIPTFLVECLQCFDGSQTELDLRAALVRITGDLEVGALGQHLIGTLSAAGFLEDAQYGEMQQARKREFAAAAVREPSHAGSAYPTDLGEMRQTMGQWMEGAETLAKPNGEPFGLARVSAPSIHCPIVWRISPKSVGYADPACDGSRTAAAANSRLRACCISPYCASSRNPAALSVPMRCCPNAPTSRSPVMRTSAARRSSSVCDPSKHCRHSTRNVGITSMASLNRY